MTSTACYTDMYALAYDEQDFSHYGALSNSRFEEILS
jgi:hypothetical protein